MPLEIERKFLVKEGLEPSQIDGISIRQGYLDIEQGKSIRVRIAGHQAFLTIKGPDFQGSRAEFEYEIPVEDADYMLSKFCESRIIDKIRRIIIWDKKIWEVDEFLGENKGLWMAELETEDLSEKLDLPEWMGKEVTGDNKYYNTYLALHPFASW
jgi:adenylate cyclase